MAPVAARGFGAPAAVLPGLIVLLLADKNFLTHWERCRVEDRANLHVRAGREAPLLA